MTPYYHFFFNKDLVQHMDEHTYADKVINHVGRVQETLEREVQHFDAEKENRVSLNCCAFCWERNRIKSRNTEGIKSGTE